MLVRIFSLSLSLAVLAWGNQAVAVDILATAASGTPYGVATIEIPVTQGVVGQELPPLAVRDSEGRVLYPVAHDLRVKLPRPSDRPVPQPGRGRLLGRVGGLIRELTGELPEQEQTVARRVSFLFRGHEPLTIELSSAGQEFGSYQLVPVQDAAVRMQLANQWWGGFHGAAQRQMKAADYPPWVETYLVAMLSGRMNAPLPEWFDAQPSDQDPLTDSLKLLAGAQDFDQLMFRRAASGGSAVPESRTLALPAPPAWQRTPVPLPDGVVEVEALAKRVPPECFYIRYGSFENYLWFRDLSDEFGGDLSQMITLQGVKNEATLRAEEQLHLRMTPLSRMLGPQVIEDQAIVGRDLFLNEGATLGVMFQAKNAFLLRNSLNNDRQQLANSDRNVSLVDVQIAGRTVTLLRSSDHRVRSFMAEDRNFFFVANSETLVRRFLEVADDGQSLAATESFQLARQLMPVQRDDTIFAYFSPEMMQGLIAPEYLIELRRRLHAKAEISLVHLARLAAKVENHSARGIDALVEAGFLPLAFGERNDNSGVITVGGRVVDTLRGARGTFMPIADVRIDAVSQEESQWYNQIAAEYANRFPQLDPIMVGIQRQTINDQPQRERLVVHAEIAPLIPEKYGKYAQQLGPPTTVAMRFAPDDIVTAQAHVASEAIGPPTHLFAGIKDSHPPRLEDFDGLLGSYRALKQLPGYLGAWPRPGALDRLPLGLGRGTPVGPGMSRLIGGLFRYSDGNYSVLSFQPEVLQASLPHLNATEVNDSAQIRVHVGNLVGSQLQGWVNSQLYQRAAESSRAGADLLSMLSHQLQIAPTDVFDAVQLVFGAELVDPLGGKYQYSQASGRWISTAWQGDWPPAEAPPQYTAPIMQWFRGAEANVTQYADRLVADAAIIVEHRAP